MIHIKDRVIGITSESLVGKENRGVVIASDGRWSMADSGQILGWVDQVKSTTEAVIYVPDSMEGVAGGTIAPGDRLTASTDGVLIATTTAANLVAGIALEGAASGQRVLFTRQIPTEYSATNGS